MANRLESIWDALRNSMNPEEEQANPISNSYSQGQGYNYPVPNEWGDSYQTFSNVDTSPMIPVTDKQVVQQPVVNNDMLPTKGSMDAMDMMAMSPQNMASGASDAAWNSQAEQRTPVEEPGFMSKMGDGISDFWNDEAKMANLAIGLNSMRLNPDANLAKAMQTKIDRLQKNKGRNATVVKLREMGRNDLADAVESGSMQATDAWTIAFKEKSKPTSREQNIALWESDPEKFALMRKLGVIGGSGTTTNVNLGGDAYDKEASKGFAEFDKKIVDLATSAPQIVQKAEKVKDLLNSGAINTGWLSNFKQGVDKVAASLGGKDALTRLSNTELLTALTGSDVFPMIKQLGIGAKGLDTPAEREFLLAVMVGTATMTTETLLDMTQQRIDKAKHNIGVYNNYLTEGKLDKYQKNRGYNFKPINSSGVVNWSDM